MKSLSNRIQGRSGISHSIVSARPTVDERINTTRKFVTEFINVGGHVIIIFELSLRERALQTLQLLQGFGEAGERARGSLSINRILRLAFQPRTHGFNGTEFFKYRAMQPHDRVAGRRQSRLVSSDVAGATLLRFSLFSSISVAADGLGTPFQVPRLFRSSACANSLAAGNKSRGGGL
jgi:hypothetical protein